MKAILPDKTRTKLALFLKLRHSDKATKIRKKTSHLICHVLSKRQIMWKIASNFFDLLRKPELFSSPETSRGLEADGDGGSNINKLDSDSETFRRFGAVEGEEDTGN